MKPRVDDGQTCIGSMLVWNIISIADMMKCTCRYMSMEELLKKMIVQAKQEGRESLRQLVAAINGMAGIHILNEKVR